MIIAGTGSRELRRNEKKFNIAFNFVKSQLEMRTEKFTLMSGMAEGFDEIIAKVAIELNLPLICAIPNKGYLKYYWGENSVLGIDRYEEACDICDYAQKTGKVEYICKNIYENGVHANFIRNEWMVNNADLMLVYAPKTPGTKHCFEYIKKVNKEYILIGE